MTSVEDPDRLHKIYMSINTETDGPDPGLNNLLELSCILHFESGEIIEELNIKLKPQKDRKPDELTMKNFWDKNNEAKEWVKKDALNVDDGINKFVDFYDKYINKYSIRFVGDPSSRDFVWLQEYYTNYAVFSTNKLYPYCRCLTTMRKSYQKMANLTDEESRELKNQMQGTDNDNHIGIIRARKQAIEFCLLRKKMYNYNSIIREKSLVKLEYLINKKLNENMINIIKNYNISINDEKNNLIDYFNKKIFNDTTIIKGKNMNETMNDMNNSINHINESVISINKSLKIKNDYKKNYKNYLITTGSIFILSTIIYKKYIKI
jgi:hypothetical protein